MKKYLRGWGLSSVGLIVPSAIINILGFILWKVEAQLPHLVGFCHALCDSVLFLTQPIRLLVLWAAYKMHQVNKRFNGKVLAEMSSAKRLHATLDEGHGAALYAQ